MSRSSTSAPRHLHNAKAYFLFALSALVACHDKASRPHPPTDLFGISEEALWSIGYRASGLTVVASRTKDGTFAVADQHRGNEPEKTCKPGARFDQGMRRLLEVRETRELSASEVRRLKQTTEDGVLHFEDVVAHEGSDIAPIEWIVYPHFEESTPVVLLDARERASAWEVDLSKSALKLLRSGCGDSR